MKKLIIALTLICANAISAPFGMNEGMTLDEIKKMGNFSADPSSPYLYSSTDLKNGHSDFERYMVMVTPGQGLCKILASGKTVESNVYGNDLQAKFSDIVVALKGKYGNPEHNFDYLKAGSIWKDQNDWMMALLKKERSLSAHWTNKNNLPDSLLSISVNARALSTSKGWIQLSYEFKNLDTCLEVLKSKQNSNL